MKIRNIHTTNPTSKKKILGDNLEIIRDHDSNGEIFFIDITKLKNAIEKAIGINNEANSKVTIYASAGNTEQEFDLGELETLSLPKNTSLNELDKDKTTYFRLIVTNSENRILASNERIKNRFKNDPKNSESLVDVDLADLGERLWKLRLEDDAPPVLLFNKNIPQVKNRIKDDIRFMASIIPEVLRMSIIHLAFNLEFDNSDETCFQSKWAKFLDMYGHDIEDLPDLMDTPDRLYDVIDIVDDLVSRFCLKNRFTSKLITLFGDEAI